MRKKDKTALEVDVGQSAGGSGRAGGKKAAFAKVRLQIGAGDGVRS